LVQACRHSPLTFPAGRDSVPSQFKPRRQRRKTVVILGAERFQGFRRFTDFRSRFRSPSASPQGDASRKDWPRTLQVARFGGFARYAGRLQDRVSYFRSTVWSQGQGVLAPRAGRFARVGSIGPKVPGSQGSAASSEGGAVARSHSPGRGWARLPRGSRVSLRRSFRRKAGRSRRKVVWPQGYLVARPFRRFGIGVCGIGSQELVLRLARSPKAARSRASGSIPGGWSQDRVSVSRGQANHESVRSPSPVVARLARDEVRPINRRLRASTVDPRGSAVSRSLCRDRRGRSSTFTRSRGRGRTGRKACCAG
jgi:hypothetical protein